MILSRGKNNFKNNVYDYWEWSAPVLRTVEEVNAQIKKMQLEGRIIKKVYAVGMGYNWCDYQIEDSVYNELDYNEKPSGKYDFLPEEIVFSKYAQIDEPFLIEFCDGDILAVDFSEGSCVRIEFNSIFPDILPGTNQRNFHANELFKDLIGCAIKSVDITISTKSDGFCYSHGLGEENQNFYVKRISFVCENCEQYETKSIEFAPFFDYGIVEQREDDGRLSEICAQDVKEVLKGFVDEKVLNSKQYLKF